MDKKMKALKITGTILTILGAGATLVADKIDSKLIDIKMAEGIKEAVISYAEGKKL